MAERNQCLHKESVNHQSEFSFCKSCSILLLSKHIKAQVPSQKTQKLDLEPLQLMEKMRRSQIPFKCSGDRRLILFRLRKLVKQYNFSNLTLHLSLDYTERVLGKVILPDYKKDLVIISCFLLAGKTLLNQ